MSRTILVSLFVSLLVACSSDEAPSDAGAILANGDALPDAGDMLADGDNAGGAGADPIDELPDAGDMLADGDTPPGAGHPSNEGETFEIRINFLGDGEVSGIGNNWAKSSRSNGTGRDVTISLMRSKRGPTNALRVTRAVLNFRWVSLSSS